MSHPRRNEVFRDVGSEEHEPGDPDFIEILRIPFEPDSALALCSDGLSDLVPSPMIRRAVETHAGYPDAAVRELIAAANSAGGKDNVTVIVVEGPRFTAPAPVAAWAGWNLIASRPAWFLCGLLAAAAGMWFSRGLWIPRPPAVPPPRGLTAGPGAAFSSISDALAQARPGDTVEALAGEYSEQVRLKSGVSLRTRDAILRAAPMGNGPAVIAENVRSARVTGLRIEAGGQAPLSAGIVLADSDVELEDVDGAGGGGGNVSWGGARAPRLRIEAGGQAPLSAGIVLADSDVELEDVDVAGAGVGIEIRGAASPVLRANSVHDCSGAGILISGPSQPWISHNTLDRKSVV